MANLNWYMEPLVILMIRLQELVYFCLAEHSRNVFLTDPRVKELCGLVSRAQ